MTRITNVMIFVMLLGVGRILLITVKKKTYYLIFILDIRDKQAGKSIINYCKKKIHNLFTDLEINQVLWQITKSQYHNISQYILVITCMFSQKTYNTCMCVYNISGSM